MPAPSAAVRPTGCAAAVEVEAEGRGDVDGLVQVGVVGDADVAPVAGESGGASGAPPPTGPTTRAGLPMTRVIGGTSRVTQRPRLDERPGPDADALEDGRHRADVDVVLDHDRAVAIGGRGRPSARLEQAIASATRRAGSIGWKSLSATVTFHPSRTWLPIVTRVLAQQHGPAEVAPVADPEPAAAPTAKLTPSSVQPAPMTAASGAVGLEPLEGPAAGDPRAGADADVGRQRAVGVGVGRGVGRGVGHGSPSWWRHRSA